ncbi:MAG: type II toxin-antitoxin system RelE/ParE family toxin [Rhodospirillales bacterium]|nr:type II toxin-antitoxin system RelE/ParE family toxin [Rhodospirillales bacterium]
MTASRTAPTGTAIPATVGSRDTDFRGQATRRFFEGQRVAAFHGFARQASSRRLTLLDSAETLRDLAALRSNRLEAPRGDRAGQHSIRINTQWRICFRWTDDGPCDVEIVDYHRGRVP